MKKIALEEAVIVPDQELAVLTAKNPAVDRWRTDLLDITGKRLADMDATETEISVLSVVTPGLQGVADAAAATTLAREWNDYLAEAVVEHQDRLKVFAALPMRDPEAAAEELRRCVTELGFVGALINGYDDAGGLEPLYYDTPEYVPFWRAVAELAVPVYVHPRTIPADRVTTYAPLPELRAAAWGWHVETGEHMLRLILSGLFDEVPNLRIVIGHMGELFVWWAWRTDCRLQLGHFRDPGGGGRGRNEKSVTHYLRNNFWVTTSGWFETPGLLHTIAVVGTERVLYSVDYPFEAYRDASDWFESLDLDESDKRMIAYGNAAALLGLEDGVDAQRARTRRPIRTRSGAI